MPIQKNSPIVGSEIREKGVSEIINLSKELGIYNKLNQQDIDHLNNGSKAVMNPLSIRDDVNYTNQKINQILEVMTNNKNINITDVVRGCIEIYKIIIRFGTIRYIRYYNDNGSNRINKQVDTPVIFTEEFLKQNYPIFNNNSSQTNIIDSSRYKGKNITDVSINEIITAVINYAKSKQKVTHTITSNDCHSNCHSNCHDRCHDDCDCNCNHTDNCDHRLCYRDEIDNCWNGGGYSNSCNCNR